MKIVDKMAVLSQGLDSKLLVSVIGQFPANVYL